MTPPASKHAAAGFTLIEILLAVTITAIVMVAVGGAFLGILQTREEVRALSDSASAGPRIMSLIERDLQGLWHYNIDENRVFLGRHLDFSGSPADRMDFLTTTDSVGVVDDGTGHPKRPSLCEVGYWLKENPKYGDLRELWRREDSLVDGDLTTGGRFQLVHDRVKTFEVTYYSSLGSNAEPVPEWDSSKQGVLPRRIKIELTVERVLPNRNRVSGAELGEFEDAIQKYTRHIVFDRRYPDILRPALALIPVLPTPPPKGDGETPLGGGGPGGGPGAGGQTSGVAGGAPGRSFAPGTSVGSHTRQTTGGGQQGGATPGMPPSGNPFTPPPRTFNINDLLRGGGRGTGGLFGSGSGR